MKRKLPFPFPNVHQQAGSRAVLLWLSVQEGLSNITYMFLLAGKTWGYKSMYAQLLHFLKELLCHQVHKFSGLERLAEIKAETAWGGTDPEDCLLDFFWLKSGKVWGAVRRAAGCRDSWRVQGSCWLQCTMGNAGNWRGFYLLAALILTCKWPGTTFWVPIFFPHLKWRSCSE